ncbi:MAG: Na+/H+ antiporter NhaC family protein [Pseudomonadota bacterium]
MASLPITLVVAVIVIGLSSIASAQAEDVAIDAPSVVLHGVPFSVTVSDPEGEIIPEMGPVLQVGDQTYPISVVDGEATVEDILVDGGDPIFSIAHGGSEALAEAQAEGLPGWVSVLPALLAILIALVFRQVIPALFLGVWLGGSLAYGFSLTSLWYGLVDTVPVHVLGALNDWGHLAIILFSLMIGGMVGIISRNGGTAGIVKAIVGIASSPKRAQMTTWGLGIAIFFDDYANTLIVGKTMRPVMDKLAVSREKLAYLVDSTAAPVATIALVTTWIGFEVGLIGDSVANIDGYDEAAYSIFLKSIAYSFYPILTLLFVLVIAASGRDFGPMLKAERRASSRGLVSREGAHTGESSADAQEHAPKPEKPQRGFNAVIPILVMVAGTFVGIYVTGQEAAGADASFRDIIGNGDAYLAMVWASTVAVVTAAILSMGQGILTLSETVDAWYAGARSMLFAVIILTLAWSLASVNDTIQTGDYLVSLLGDTVAPQMVPAIVFVLAAGTAFATGSSWGVMGIVMPLSIPLVWAIMAANGMTADDSNLHLIYATAAAVMGGAVWGDHCSPISDTTILSSLASSCDHIDHVRTQLPYAIPVGFVAVVVGLIPTGYGYSWWLCLLVGAAIVIALIFLLGRRSDAGAPGTHPVAAPEPVKSSGDR